MALDNSKLFVVGKYCDNFNKHIGAEIKSADNLIYQSQGLKIHIEKRHPDYAEYVGKVSEIIDNPDYIGVNPNEEDPSIELIKQFDENILIGIKLDVENDYFYVSTLHEVKQSKIERRLYSGRLKKYAE